MQSNIRQLRKERHISQTELGQVLGVSQQMVSRIEKDRERIQIRQLLILSDYFGVSTDYILNYRDTLPAPEAVREQPNAGWLSSGNTAQLEEQLAQSGDQLLYHLFMFMKSYMQGRLA